MRKGNTEFSKYFNGHVDTVIERFLIGEDVSCDDIYGDVIYNNTHIDMTYDTYVDINPEDM